MGVWNVVRAPIGGVAMLLALGGCGGSHTNASDSTAVGTAARTLFDDPSAVIALERGVILGVRIYMPADSVKTVLGAPLREGSDPGDTTGVTVLEYPMGTIKVQKVAGVSDFLCGGDQCQTADSVGIGDSSDVVLRTYGPTPPRGPAEDPEALDYRLGQSDCNLTFTLSAGRVTSLSLGCAVRPTS